MTIDNTTHEHNWQPNLTGGRARYQCECGAHARRLMTNDFLELKPNEFHLTVAFKPTGPRIQDFDTGSEPPKRIHSTRNTLEPVDNETNSQLEWILRNTKGDAEGLQKRKRGRPRLIPRKDEALIDAAWKEWRVGEAYRGVAPDASEVRPPKWFVEIECGYRLDCGPSLSWTCERLERTNTTALVQLGTAAPKRVTYPRNFKHRLPRPRPAPSKSKKMRDAQAAESRCPI